MNRCYFIYWKQISTPLVLLYLINSFNEFNLQKNLFRFLERLAVL